MVSPQSSPAPAAAARPTGATLAGKSNFRVLILDNVIINTGDAAIMLAMKQSMEAVFGPGTEVRNDFTGGFARLEDYIPLYPELHFLQTPTNVAYVWPLSGKNLWGRIVRKTSSARFLMQARLHAKGLPIPVLLPKERRLFQEYLDADLIIVSGGAALSTSWTQERQRAERVAKYWTALTLKKPLAFYAQSFGPFIETDPLPQMLKPLVARADAVLCRDADSLRVVHENIGVQGENIHQTIDEVLLLTPLAPPKPIVPEKRKPLRLGICVHKWHWLKESDPQAKQNAFEARMAKVCTALLERGDTELLFVTTHQGMEGIPHDDEVSVRIHAQIPEALRADALVYRDFVHPRHLSYTLGQCDMVVSSRLHGAILSMVGGAPVVALAYEPKTRGLMRQIGLEDWVLSMGDSPAEDILAQAQGILADLLAARQRLAEAMTCGQALARRNQEIIYEAVRKRLTKEKTTS